MNDHVFVGIIAALVYGRTPEVQPGDGATVNRAVDVAFEIMDRIKVVDETRHMALQALATARNRAKQADRHEQGLGQYEGF